MDDIDDIHHPWNKDVLAVLLGLHAEGVPRQPGTLTVYPDTREYAFSNVVFQKGDDTYSVTVPNAGTIVETQRHTLWELSPASATKETNGKTGKTECILRYVC
jgi:hypothetical protein